MRRRARAGVAALVLAVTGGALLPVAAAGAAAAARPAEPLPPAPQYAPGPPPAHHASPPPSGTYTMPPPSWHTAPQGAPDGPSPRQAAARATPSQVATAFVRLLNRERAAAGCRPVRTQRTLTYVAQQHSAYLAKSRTLTHTDAYNRDVGERLNAAGYRWRRAAENLAVASSDAPSALREWKESPRHRRSMLTCAFRHAGVGAVRSGGRTWWTLTLAVPAR
ncbi:CAP domain-containing protein [Streptomyces sp. NPDC088745]|uniref:CAP domain-containing protein n=1 Tax=Streptomyces sp. NPDC088745 TaxID=3365884 RepID=UPI003824A3DB